VRRARRILVDNRACRHALEASLARTKYWARSLAQHGRRQHSAGANKAAARRLIALESVTIPVSDIVLIIGRDAVALANGVASAVPGATVHLLTVEDLTAGRLALLRPTVTHKYCRNIAERVAYLSLCAQPQVIIERGSNRRKQKLACFTELFPFVAVGGIYRVEALILTDAADEVPNIYDLLRSIESIHAGGGGDVSAKTRELAASADRVEVFANDATIRKAVAHQYKMRDCDANALLAARFGFTWGTVIAREPALRWTSGVRYVAHGTGPRLADKSVIDVPERYLRRYRGPTCLPRQRLRYGDYWLPDTFRHALDPVLSHRRLTSASRCMARDPTDQPMRTRSLPGSYFYFDTEFPAHFGHVLSEVVSRYWGWQAAREVAHDLHPLVGLWHGRDEMPDFQRAIFGALDIDVDRVEYFRPDEAVEVETLFAATPDFVMPQYVTAGLADVWNTIRVRCADTSLAVSSERLFVSRRPKHIRTCLNSAEVEGMFRRLGFDIVYPEQLDFSMQVQLFHRAKVIAGFGGSGMFNSMFAPGATVIVISGDGFRANNEYLIRVVVGGTIHYFWGDSLVKQPPVGFSWAAYQANFTFDVPRFESEIREITERAFGIEAARSSRKSRRSRSGD
jgi:capsular polysaccharide biosynthesis protein